MTRVKQRTKELVPITARELCMKRFKEWWPIDELSEIISQINPDIIMMFSNNDKEIFNEDRLAEILYDSVGTRFLRNIENDTIKRRIFLQLILETVVIKGIKDKEVILETARVNSSVSRRKTINELSNIVELDINNKLGLGLADVLGLPPSVAEKEHVETLPDTEVIVPYVPLNPLYDYQYTTGRFVRGMLEGTATDNNKEVKRKIISVPTGAGKTRMLVETIIEWLNDGKPSKNAQQRDSKFILWVAQSSELCEQAFSTFRSIFEANGRRGTTLHLHRFWGAGGALPTLGMDDLLDEKGIIVATIQSLYKIYSQPAQLTTLAKITACIIVDEAHHATAPTYSNVLREMGFNWDNRKREISEMGIILIGLTATPFRGKGNNEETIRLNRRLNGTYFPTIPYSDDMKGFRPHALVDCQTFAYAGEHIKILGERSYDREGAIKPDGYSWRIVRQIKKNATDSNGENAEVDKKEETPDNKEKGVKKESIPKKGESESQTEWTFQGDKNITFEFPYSGKYDIYLTIIDNKDNVDTANEKITIMTKPKEENMTPVMRQKGLYSKLIKRKILCDVFHYILEADSISLNSQDIIHMKTYGEFRKDTLKSIGRNRARNTMIIKEMDKLNKLGRKKILFFGCSVNHSRQIAMLLKTIYRMNVRYVDSKMDMDSRVNAIELFRSGDLDVLCNFDVLTTGFDAPNVDCVFVGRPVKSTLLYTQMIGRGMRGTKSGGTDDVILVDIDDNFQLQNKYDEVLVGLGWKTFREYWKPWIMPGSNTSSQLYDEFYSSDDKEQRKQPSKTGLEWEALWAGSDDDDTNKETIPEPSQEHTFEYKQESVEPADYQSFMHTCSSCGVVAVGISSIQRVFGIEGALEILAEILRNKDYKMLPAKCQRCRNNDDDGE